MCRLRVDDLGMARRRYRSLTPWCVAFTGEGKLVRKATGYEQEKAEAALSHIGFAGCASRASGAPLERIGDPQISPTRHKKGRPAETSRPGQEFSSDSLRKTGGERTVSAAPCPAMELVILPKLPLPPVALLSVTATGPGC